ncbi:MAG: hypothetical protein ACI31S_05955 [Bacilli bacterium]
MDKVVSFPHLGNYSIVFDYFLSNVLKCKVLVPPLTTKRTIELGSKYAPDFVCVPFKYNLGNYIEALENGSNILIQGGGGCRYGYYAELQEEILKNLGYNFKFYNLISDNHISLMKGYKFCKEINPKTNIFKCGYYLFNSLLMVICIDKIEKYIRSNMGFEVNNGQFEELEKEYFKSFNKSDGWIRIFFKYLKYKRKFKSIKVNKNNNCLKVMFVGELYSLIDANTSYNAERKLMKMGVEVYRKTDLTYLLLGKKFKLWWFIKKSRSFIKYNLGADASLSVYNSLKAVSEGYDGIVHMKSFGCIPELSAISILDKISNEYNIPIMHLSFDAEDNEVGIDTRIEAFYDMIEGRK